MMTLEKAWNWITEKTESVKSNVDFPKVSIRTSMMVGLAMALTPDSELSAQSETTKIDYTQKSNAINPDTLRGDQKLIFDHFVHHSSEDLEAIDMEDVVSTFINLGLPYGDPRLWTAYEFFSIEMQEHKLDVEQWKRMFGDELEQPK